jgi:hypothetical protein
MEKIAQELLKIAKSLIGASLSPKEEELIRLMAPGFKKLQLREQVIKDQYWASPERLKRLDEILDSQPDWAVVKGVKVLRIKNSDNVAVPNKNKFDIIDIENGVLVAQVDKKDVRTWLIRDYFKNE